MNLPNIDISQKGKGVSFGSKVEKHRFCSETNESGFEDNIAEESRRVYEKESKINPEKQAVVKSQSDQSVSEEKEADAKIGDAGNDEIIQMNQDDLGDENGINIYEGFIDELEDIVNKDCSNEITSNVSLEDGGEISKRDDLSNIELMEIQNQAKKASHEAEKEGSEVVPIQDLQDNIVDKMDKNVKGDGSKKIKDNNAMSASIHGIHNRDVPLKEEFLKVDEKVNPKNIGKSNANQEIVLQAQRTADSFKLLSGEQSQKITVKTIHQMKLGHEVNQQIKDALSANVNNENPRRVEIQLDPPQLGKIFIKIHLNAKQMNLEFLTEQGFVKEAIVKSVFELRESLMQDGLNLGDIDVGVGDKSMWANDGFARGGFNMEVREELISDVDEEIEINRSKDPLASVVDSVV